MSGKSEATAEASRRHRRAPGLPRHEAAAEHGQGPRPPRAWASTLRGLIAASEEAREDPSWWTPANAYFGSVETRTDPQSYYWDGMKRASRRDRKVVFFQLTLAGFGHFELRDRPPEPLPPGTGFFAVVPSRHRYYLPETSPGWTFAWIGTYHPYIVRRVAKQVASTGPIVRVAPGSELLEHFERLVRGAFLKDFRDRFAVEDELFALMHAYERLGQTAPNTEGERLLEALRSRVLANPKERLDVGHLAAEYGMSRTGFSHDFRARTGASPASFMTEVRVQAAARLLVTTRLPLVAIADQCGFANANHFGKVFRRFRHVSAGAYRRAVG